MSRRREWRRRAAEKRALLPELPPPVMPSKRITDPTFDYEPAADYRERMAKRHRDGAR